MRYLPIKCVKVSVEEGGGRDAEAEQDGPGQVEGRVEARRAGVELDEADPGVPLLLLTGILK